MISKSYMKTKAVVSWLTLVTFFVMPISVLAQTRIVAPNNKYSVQDDIKLGREAAQQVRQQMPLLQDGNIDNYIESVGQRSVVRRQAGTFGVAPRSAISRCSPYPHDTDVKRVEKGRMAVAVDSRTAARPPGSASSRRC